LLRSRLWFLLDLGSLVAGRRRQRPNERNVRVFTAKEERAAAVNGEGCLGKAADDEPVFVLRAKDALAADLIELWADWAHRAGASAEKTASAVQIAEAMRNWQRANGGHKIPD
jgi:hypothetical protein